MKTHDRSAPHSNSATWSRYRPAFGLPPTASSLLALWLWCVADAQAQTAQWIWPPASQEPGTTITLQREFQLPAAAAAARLTFVGDFCRTRVRLNGQEIALGEPYDAPTTLEVASSLRAAANQIEIEGTATGGPCAVAVRLDITPLTGPPVTLVSDQSWHTAPLASHASNAVTELGEVREFELDPQRQFRLDAADDYEQWRRALQAGPGTNPATFRVPPEFEITLVRSALPTEGSWISLEFDPQGRLLIGREDRGILRMSLATDRRSVTQVETVDDTLLECRGLLYAHNSLYVNANNSKGTYRLRDTDGDDRFDDVRLLKRFEGSVGHGRNDLALGPEGMVYLIHGDSVAIPRDARDWTSPLREHRQGKNTSEGHLLRTDRQGAHWEVLAAGLRNPYGLAFHQDGEPFTYDADAEFDMGAPWYRPTQVKHLVPGSDFGWRGVTGQWPPYYPDHPDNAPPSVVIGKGSPTSVQFGYRSHFPAPYRNALFILDWAYGRIIAVHLTPRGASYSGHPETFLQGRPLNVTDLGFGPDGALYFVTGGRKTQAGLYRVSHSGQPRPPEQPTVQQQARERYSLAARHQRRYLESLFHSPASEVVPAAWSALDSADPCLRHTARIALERTGFSFWKEQAWTESAPTAQLTAWGSLARGDKTSRAAILDRLVHTPLAKLSLSQREMACHIILGCLDEPDPRLLTDLRRQALVELLEKQYPDRSFAINRPLSQLLVQLNSPVAVPRTLDLLEQSREQAEQLHYLFALRNARIGWTPDARRRYASSFQRSATYLGGQGMAGFLQKIRDDLVAATPAAEQTPVAQSLEVRVQDEPLPQRPFVRTWKMAELEDVASATDIRGNRDRGSRLFQEALCARCHRVGPLGQLLGPDLTDVGRRFHRRDILQAILDPSLVVAENYRTERVETADGRVLTGRVVTMGDFRSSLLRLNTDPLRPSQFVEVPKQAIVSHSTLPTSPMPAGLLDTLSREEIADLLAFLTSGGSTPAP